MSTPPLDPIYCRKCKKQIPSDAVFCPACGVAQAPAPEAPPVLTPEPPPAPPATGGFKLRFPLWARVVVGIWVIFRVGSCLFVRDDSGQRDYEWERKVAENNRKWMSSPVVTPVPATPTPPPLATMPTFTQSRPQQRQVDQALLARINAVGNIVAENGGYMNVQGATVRVTVPGGRIDEYSAQRLAKTLGDRIGAGMTIRVYDDVGLERAKYTAW